MTGARYRSANASAPHWTLLPALAFAAALLSASSLAAQTVEIIGRLHAVWFDAQQPGGPSGLTYFVTTDAGTTYRLRAADIAVARIGDPGALRGRRVRVSGTRVVPDGVTRVQPNVDVATIQLLDDGPAPERPRWPDARIQQSGAPTPKPYVTVLCKYADSTSVEPRSRAQYEQLSHGETYPAQSHYWPLISGGVIRLDGSSVMGWYVLPLPKAHYFDVKDDGSPDLGAALLDRMTRDCIGAADADVDFSQYFGINLQFNGWAGFAYGGGWHVAADGLNRDMPMTWLASWAGPHIYAHEIGHSLGLPHSSTPYESSYGSFWDVMSSGGFNDASINEWVPGGTIAYHHTRLGSLVPSSELTPVPGTRQTLEIELLNGTASAVRMLRLPLGDGTFYTAEARRRTGPYERWLPHDGILLHRVDTTRIPGRDWVPARVVDGDENGNPNDAGAIRSVGETWTDPAAGYSLTVLAETPTGYTVSVRRGFAVVATRLGTGTVRIDGTVCTTSPCEHIVAGTATPVTIVAAPEADAQFLGWSDACTGTTPTCTVTLSRDRAVTARFGRPITIATSAFREAVIGVPYADTLRAEGGIDGIRWEFVAGALPTGLSLDLATGVLAGTPTAAGPVTLHVRARSDVLEAVAELALAVVPPLTVASDATRPPGLLGLEYGDTVTAAGGAGDAAWTVVGGTLPPGVTLSPTGALTGAPTEAGAYGATLAAASGSQRIERTFSWTIHAAFAVASDSLRPAATMGATYRDSLAVTGGITGTRWQLADGALPPGLALADSSGVLYGVPEASGAFTFTVEVVANRDRWQAVRVHTVTVGAPAVTVDALLAHVTATASLPADVLRYLDLLGNRNARLDVGDIAAWVDATRPQGAAVARLLGAAAAFRAEHATGDRALTSAAITASPSATGSTSPPLP